MEEMKSPTPGYVVCGIGGVLVAIGAIWGFVIGFYEHERLFVIAVAGGGAALLWLGERMFQAARRNQAEQRIAQRKSGQ
ncbi:MAG: hypothetical protein IPL36_13695 [Nigerium sp.]|nr:hypothetical protein [Nigerium sp.]